MEQFSEAVVQLVQEQADPAKIEAALRRLLARKVEAVDGFAVSPVSRLPVKIVVLHQVGVRRVIELTDASIREINRQDVSAMCVLVRAAFETACLLYDVARHLESVVTKGDTAGVDDLDTHLVDVLLGHKSKDWALSEEIVSRNVLTIVQRLTKQLEIPLMWFYEGLSEHAHPNYHGMLATYSAVRQPPDDVAITRFTDRREGRTKATTVLAISALVIALDLMEAALDKQEKFLKDFAALAERKVQSEGKWPKDLDYPVQRG